MAKNTGKVNDDRTLHRAIRLPGKRIVKSSVVKGERKLKSLDDGKFEVYQPGRIITDPDALARVAKDGRVNLAELQQAGIISGNW